MTLLELHAVLRQFLASTEETTGVRPDVLLVAEGDPVLACLRENGLSHLLRQTDTAGLFEVPIAPVLAHGG